jgi:hypothetical protein
MKFLTFLLFAAFTIGADAVKGSPRQTRFLKEDNGDGGNCVDQDEAFYTQASEDCEICSRCNKVTPVSSISFKYTSAGMNSRYQSSDYATCAAGTYPSRATVTVAGQTFQVSEGTVFELLAPAGGKFDANTVFTISEFGDCIIHLSCSAPIVAGDIIGPFEVLGKDDCDPVDIPGGCTSDGCLICDQDTKTFPNGASRKPNQLTFIYRSAGTDSAFQDITKATCVAGTYPSSTTISVEGQTFDVVDGTQFTVNPMVAASGFPSELDFTFSEFTGADGTNGCFIHASCSVPIIAGDQIGPLVVVGDSKSCIVCEENECIKTDKKTYDCGDPIVIDFDITDVTDGLGQSGPLSSDWIGIYPCDVPFNDDSFYFPIVNKYVCDQFVGEDRPNCILSTSQTYPSGTLTIDKLPPYGEIGPYIWPVTAFRDGDTVQTSFKAVIMRDDGPSVPPFIPICESECFTIIPDEMTQLCETRDSAIEFNPVTPTGGFVACFPGDAALEVAGKGKVSMKDISLGDKVLTDNNKYEAIYSFGHRNEAATMEFVKLVTAGKSLELSKDHLVYANGQAVPASIVKVGDELQLADGSLSAVLAIKIAIKTGVFAPFTASGTIIVNGIKASTFIAFQESATAHVAGIDTGITFQFLAQFFEFPQQVWCAHFSACDTETYTTEGISTRVSGLHTLFVWLFAQNFAVMATTVVAVAVACTSFRVRSTKKVV